MKKIINQRRYDTESAKQLGIGGNDVPRNDFNWYREVLYLKKTGEFFLYGEGGPMTRYAEKVGNSGWTSGETIQPLTADEARQWAEENLTADHYEEIFGPVSEGDPNDKQTVTLSIPVSAAEQLRRLSYQTGKTMSDLVTEWIWNA